MPKMLRLVSDARSETGLSDMIPFPPGVYYWLIIITDIASLNIRILHQRFTAEVSMDQGEHLQSSAEDLSLCGNLIGEYEQLWWA